MDLKERKKKILEVIIKDYINSAEPVGSRTLSKRYNLGISPATIRNEMADLEDMGFLMQPHTSSGRIPTQKAYRYYVDEIMQVQKLAKVLRNDIHNGYLEVTRELDNTMNHTAKVISQLTNYASVVLSPRITCFNCKYVQLIPLIRERILMVVVTREGLAKNVELSLSKEIDAVQAMKLSNVLNSFLKNISFSEMNLELIDQIQDLSIEEAGLLREIFPVLRKTLLEEESEVRSMGISFSEMNLELIDQIQDLSIEEAGLLREIFPVLRKTLLEEESEVRSMGLTNLFNYPEFSDVDKIRHLVNVIEEKPLLADILSDGEDQNQVIRISIGDENDNENLKELSIITATYELNGETVGAFGVIGPTRMNYDNVSSVLDYIRNELNMNLSKLLMK